MVKDFKHPVAYVILEQQWVEVSLYIWNKSEGAVDIFSQNLIFKSISQGLSFFCVHMFYLKFKLLLVMGSL